MNPPFPLFQQPLGSQSCVPTCVRSVLFWHGMVVSQDEVSEWCLEDADGCDFFLAAEGLQQAGFDVVKVPDEATLLELFAGDEPEPVIILLRHPVESSNSDHAVVIHAIRQQKGVAEVVDYMDPLDGANHQNKNGVLLNWWDFNGCRAFIVRP